MAGLWALGAHRFQPLRRRSLWWFTLVAELAVFVQVGLGVALQGAEDVEPPEFHALYGYAGIVAVGIVYSYRDSMRGRLHLLYGFGGLFLMGLGIRAMVVGT